MPAVQIAYDFTSSLNPSVLPAGWSASSPITEVGASVITRQTTDGGILRYDPATGSKTQTTSYMVIDFGPTDPSQVWTPGTVTFRARRNGSLTEFRVRHAGGGSGLIGSDNFVMTTSYVDCVVDVSDVGPITGNLSIRVYGYQQFSSNYIYYDTITMDGTYVDPAVDVTVSGIASAEAFGGHQIFVPATQDVFPDGLASAEAFGGLQVIPDQTFTVVGIPGEEGFGSAQVLAIPNSLIEPSGIEGEESFGGPQVLSVKAVQVVGIASAQSFGLAEVGITTPEIIVDYPTGEDIATFLGATNVIVPQAEEALSIIRSMARAYTRGNGFFTEGLKEELRDMIVSATGRLLGNPDQIDIQVGATRRRSFFKGWTLAEQKVLNSYRKVAS